MEDLGVEIRLNTSVDRDMASNGYDEVFVCTGATERTLNIPGLDESNSSYAVDAFSKGAQGGIPGTDILIIGGGLTGCELAYELSKQGKRVTIVELADTILNVFGLSAANYNMLMELLDHHRVRVIKSASVKRVENGVAHVEQTIKNLPNIANRAKMIFALGPQGTVKTIKVKADHTVISVGYHSNSGLTATSGESTAEENPLEMHADANMRMDGIKDMFPRLRVSPSDMGTINIPNTLLMVPMVTKTTAAQANTQA